MAEEDIRALKVALDVATDADLASKLGVERSTVAQWKRRGSVPSKYAYLLDLAELPSQAEKNMNAVRHHYLGRADHQWLLKVALGFLPLGPDSVLEEDEATLGEYRERVVVTMMGYASLCSLEYLEKSHPQNVEEYDLLVRKMKANYRDSIDALVSSLRAPRVEPGPQ